MFLIFISFIALIAATIASKIVFQRASLGFAAGLVFVIFVLAFESITVVPAGHRGVQVTMGTVNPVALESGWQFVNPISNVKDVNVQIQRATYEGAAAGTKDLQQVHTDIVANYRLSPEKVALIYRDFGLNVVDKDRSEEHTSELQSH